MNYMFGFLVACIVLGLWGPKRVPWLKWLIPVAAVLLVAFFLITSLHRV